MSMSFKEISKSFPGTKALDEVSFDIWENEIHGLVGENGAGKTTLMKVLVGAYKPDSGDIFFMGKPCKFDNVHDARSTGIEMVYQESGLLPNMTISENIFLGKESTKYALIDNKFMQQETQKSLEIIGLQVSPSTRVADLPVRDRKLVEIAKAVYQDPKVLVLDEPTAYLDSKSKENLFDLLYKLKDGGLTAIFISHDIKEVLSLCDRITVLKDGKYIATLNATETSEDELIKLMVGREVCRDFRRVGGKPSEEVVLSVENLSKHGKYQNITFQLYKGEILGICGLRGSGKFELGRALFGYEKPESGTIKAKGRVRSINDAMRNGVGYIPEERKIEGLIQTMSVKDNISLPILETITKGGFISSKEEKEITRKLVDDLKIVTPSMSQLAKYLSGGNQQKTVVAKWLAYNAEILILQNPTVGVDVGSKMDIHMILRRLADNGTSLILISDEIIELMGLCDRIITMRNGEISAIFSNEKGCKEEEILRYML